MFKKKYVLASMMLLAGLCVQAGEKKELHILSANDMHAAIECMPRVGFVADSLRALYPNLLVLSAGDNRSGEPLNDMYEIPAYPMVALMNIIGFNATTLGNHEFDSGQEGAGQAHRNVELCNAVCQHAARCQVEHAREALSGV